MPPSKSITVALLLSLLSGPLLAQGPQTVSDDFRDPKDREFDFWVGEWDVLLRIKQDDQTWKDSRYAQANIYRVLGGKAILELWDEKVEGPGIRGFSLRLYDHEQGHWVLYLNWPGPNRSAMGRLTGEFRHGRGEFFSTRMADDSTEIISRYTFSDISPQSLRWDDAYSRDGGATWSNSWIMEFSRRAEWAEWPAPGEKAHTYHTGERCNLSQFREFERLAGRWEGTVEVRGPDGGTASADAHLSGYRVLDGCAVITFLEYEMAGKRYEEFAFSTYNTFGEALQDTRLDNRPGTPVRNYYGATEDGALVLESSQREDHQERYRWTFNQPDRFSFEVRDLAGDEEIVTRTGSFRRVAE